MTQVRVAAEASLARFDTQILDSMDLIARTHELIAKTDVRLAAAKMPREARSR